jgi:NitT/TauT family transport system substrate-binding protein
MLLCTIFLAPALSGCGSGAGTSKIIVINEAVHTAFYAPLYVAMENGYFKGEGLKVKLGTGLGWDKTAAALRSGDCDFALMGPETGIYEYNNEAADYFVTVAQLTQRAGDFLVSRDLNEEFTWDHIKGKTCLGGRADGLPQMAFEYILKKHGIDPKTDLTMINDIGFGLTSQAFSSGQGDYTLEMDTTAYALDAGGSGKLVASLGEESGKIPYTVFCVNKSFLAKHPELVQSFTAALQKGLDYVNKHTSEEVAKVIKPQFGETGREELVQILDRYYAQKTWKDNLIFEKGSYILLEDILIEAGQLKTRVPYEDIIATEYAEKAVNK